MSKKRKNDEEKILLSEEPWKVFNMLKQIQDQRREQKYEDKYSPSELYNLFVKVWQYWKKGIDKSIEIIQNLYFRIKEVSKLLESYHTTESRQENSKRYIEYIKVHPHVMGIAIHKKIPLQDKIILINNFLNNLDIYISKNIENRKKDMQNIKNSIHKNFINQLNRYKLLINEKKYLDNISWIMDGDGMIPKRIKTVGTIDGTQYIIMSIISNGAVVGDENIELPNNERRFKMFGEDPNHSYVTDFDSGEESDFSDNDSDSDSDNDGEDLDEIVNRLQQQQHAGKKHTRKRYKNKGGKSKRKKTKSKKSSKTKKRNVKIYHNAYTKTNRKKRVS